MDPLLSFCLKLYFSYNTKILQLPDHRYPKTIAQEVVNHNGFNTGMPYFLIIRLIPLFMFTILLMIWKIFVEIIAQNIRFWLQLEIFRIASFFYMLLNRELRLFRLISESQYEFTWIELRWWFKVRGEVVSRFLSSMLGKGEYIFLV